MEGRGSEAPPEAQKLRQENETLQAEYNANDSEFRGYVHWAVAEMTQLQEKLQGKRDEIRALVRELEDYDHWVQQYKEQKEAELEAKTAEVQSLAEELDNLGFETEAYKAEKEEEIRNECEWSSWYRQQWEALHKRMAEQGETDSRAAKSHRTA